MGRRIEHIGRYADSMFVILNNDAAAKSVVNALQLKAIVSGVRAAVCEAAVSVPGGRLANKHRMKLGMSRRFTLEVELPDDLVATLGAADIASKAKEALIMELLREHRISQGKAADLLNVKRSDLFPLMTKYQVSVIDLPLDELRDELHRPLPQ